jgi:hypothetical protein
MNTELETKYMRGVLPPRGKYIKLVPTGRYHEGVEIMEPVDVTVMVEALESAWTKRQESALAELAEIKRRFDALELSTQQRKPQFKEFIEWAASQGYDCAHACNPDTGKWIALNPMTADLWKAWKAAYSIKATS